LTQTNPKKGLIEKKTPHLAERERLLTPVFCFSRVRSYTARQRSEWRMWRRIWRTVRVSTWAPLSCWRARVRTWASSLSTSALTMCSMGWRHRTGLNQRPILWASMRRRSWRARERPWRAAKVIFRRVGDGGLGKVFVLSEAKAWKSISARFLWHL